jgi:hypothetical protein
VVSLNRVWQPEFKKQWLDFCLIKPTPKEDYFCAPDRHEVMVIRGNNDKVIIVYP